MRRKTEARNRDIFAAYQGGAPIEDIAVLSKLSPITVRHIILTEKHKQAVSADEFYQALRPREPAT